MNDELHQMINSMQPTGSKAFGLPNPDDDDRFCLSAELAKLKDALSAARIPWTSGYAYAGEKIRFVLDGQKYDVFSVDYREYGNVMILTEVMKTLCDMARTAMQNKKNRVLFFETIRALLKAVNGC